MTQNVGAADRTVRIAIGILLLLAAGTIESPNRWFGLIGFIPLVTGMFGTCPLYALFGINTCAIKAKAKAKR